MMTFELGSFDSERWEIFKQCGHSGTFIFNVRFLFIIHKKLIFIELKYFWSARTLVLCSSLSWVLKSFQKVYFWRIFIYEERFFWQDTTNSHKEVIRFCQNVILQFLWDLIIELLTHVKLKISLSNYLVCT